MQTSSATSRQGKRVEGNQLTKEANSSTKFLSGSVSGLGSLLWDEEHIHVKS